MDYSKYFNYIKGSLLGGAMGDALGYPVEFLKKEDILNKYGEAGITSYDLAPNGKALISDDTQMTLFTIKGILVGEMRSCLNGVAGLPSCYVFYSYQDWLRTQNKTFSKTTATDNWLMDIPELNNRRAPGNTCLQALAHYHGTKPVDNFITNKINDSKGCGGIMRIAPLALRYGTCNIENLDIEAAQISAITHSHPLGFIPSAVLNHIINTIIYRNENLSLKNIVIEAVNTVARIFDEKEYSDDINYMCKLVELAIELSTNDDTDINNINKLGEGWVAEETLAIAVYCSLKYQNDFSKAIIAAVNHSGDSDSTGAITGNIVGAIVGYDAIDSKWKNDLEIIDVLLEVANSLCFAWR